MKFKGRIQKRILSVILSLAFVLSAPSARADASREFLMSCTYGVLAGTILGTASLAFTSQPGENLKNIARGASLGLYAGIILGLYVVYIVPGQSEDDEIPGQVRNSIELAPKIIPLMNAEEQIDGMYVAKTIYQF